MNISVMGGIFASAQVVGDNVLMSAKHGVGKTDVVRQFAKENDYHCETLILSLLEETDLMGMPHISGNSTTFAEPMWLTRMKKANEAGKHCVLFLDELNRASTPIRNASMSLILDRRINDHILPEIDGVKTLVISAINPSDDYQVEELDIALLDRFAFYHVEADAVSWLKWARSNKVNGIVRDFISENHSKLHFTPDTDNDIGATPRSWTMLGKYIDNIQNIDATLHFDVIKSKVGSALGSQFYSFLNNYVNVVKVDDIEKFTKKHKPTEKTIVEVAELLKEERLEKIEPTTQTELVTQMWEKYMDKAEKTEDILPMLVTLYALDLEVRAGILKDYKAKDSTNYAKLAKLDYNKNLFKSVTNRIEK